MHGTITIKPERQTESNDGEVSGEHLGTLLRQVSKTSIGEIDSLIVNSGRCTKSYRLMATAFNATLRNTPN
jgi:hypothetical protein